MKTFTLYVQSTKIKSQITLYTLITVTKLDLFQFFSILQVNNFHKTLLQLIHLILLPICSNLTHAESFNEPYHIMQTTPHHEPLLSPENHQILFALSLLKRAVLLSPGNFHVFRLHFKLLSSKEFSSTNPPLTWTTALLSCEGTITT